MKKSYLVIGSAFCIYLILSLFIYRSAPSYRAHYDHDSYGYDRIACNFQQHGLLSDPGVRGGIPIQPVGYPLFMGTVYKAIGYNPLAVIWLQLLIMLAIFLLIFVLARRFFSETIAYISLFLAAFNLGFLVYPQLLLAETMLVFFLLVFFERLTVFWQHKRKRDLATAGLIAGVSVLIKPMLLLYMFFVVPFVLFCVDRSWRFRLQAIAGLLAAFYVPMLCYMCFNYSQYGFFRYAPMTPLNMYQCYLSKVIGRVEGVPVEPVRTGLLRFTGDHGFDDTGWQTGRTLFYRYLKQYPFTCLYVWFENVTKTFLGLFSTQLKVMLNPAIVGGDHSFFKLPGSFFERLHAYIFSGGGTAWWLGLIALFETLWSFIRLFFIGLACWLLVKERRYCLLYLIGSFSLQSAFVTGIDGCCRYRVTFEPFLIMLTAVGIYALYHDCWKRRSFCMQKELHEAK